MVKICVRIDSCDSRDSCSKSFSRLSCFWMFSELNEHELRERHEYNYYKLGI